MLDSILKLEQTAPGKEQGVNGTPQKFKRKASRALSSVSEHNVTKELDLEYVYDVYYRDKAVQQTWEVNKIGYIKFEEDSNDLVNEEDNDSLLAVSDDEDSNAEDFYQNDYPEDEDAGNENDGLEVEVEVEEAEVEVDAEELELEYSELYEEHFVTGGDDIPKDFLQSLADDEESDDDMDYSGDDENDYKRQNFFPDEEEDELAQHRDRIFGKLEKMIDKH